LKTANKILSVEALLETLKAQKAAGKKVAFTNGCFDIMHLGHIDYLEKAAEKADFLVVGLNSDDSVRRLKGESRPLQNEYARARMLAALAFVDAVVLFEEDTPLKLITSLLPDILVKGSDYQLSNIVGADIVMQHGGKVETIDLVPQYSTTGIIEQIKKTYTS
jgi:rfaE bifunctional protein nucleotidyltransferase chain/domain